MFGVKMNILEIKEVLPLEIKGATQHNGWGFLLVPLTSVILITISLSFNITNTVKDGKILIFKSQHVKSVPLVKPSTSTKLRMGQNRVSHTRNRAS